MMSALASVRNILLAAGALGSVAGVASVAVTPQGREALSHSASEISASAGELALASGLARAREPQAGDYWRGCNEARAAGTAPIYAGEPGYRSKMDGDNDGIACEPYY